MLALVRTLLVLLLVSACHRPAATSSPAKEANDPGKDLMPKGATGVIVARSDDPNKLERSFSVRAAYPALGIGDDGFARLKSQGWKSCASEHDQWKDYVDKSRAVPATVFRRTQYWQRGNDVLTIVFVHRVELGTDTSQSPQRVTLSFRGAQSAEEIDQWNRFLGGSCGAGPKAPT